MTSSKTYSFPFWQTEKVFQPPATKTISIEIPAGTKILSATLKWNINLSGATFDRLSLNGYALSTAFQGSTDVSGVVITNGQNTCALDYSETWNWLGNLVGVATGTVNVVLDVVVATNAQGQPIDSAGRTVQIGMTAPDKPFEMPWYGWAAIVLCVVAVIAVVVWKVFKVNPVSLAADAIKGVL
jgi:hypothetical protein